MPIVGSRRSVMSLFSSVDDADCHRVRMVLLEKKVASETVFTDFNNFPDELLDFNPYKKLPTLVDRDLVIFGAEIIMEYIDERFPHPPLMPVDPVSRARTRTMLFRIEHDWYSLIAALNGSSTAAANEARAKLRDALTSISPVFQAKPFFMSDDFSLIDCSIAALLWRLPAWKIDLPAHAKPILEYAERVFKRPSFVNSLTAEERALRGLE